MASAKKAARPRAIVRGGGRPARGARKGTVAAKKHAAKQDAKAVAARSAARDAARQAAENQRSLDRLRERNPHLWLQVQRVGRLMEIQSQLADQQFPPGCCFVHANVVSVSNFCVKQVKEINLQTAQVTIDIHGDENLEAGTVLLPLETIEWFGFPSTAVPIEIHFHGFTADPGRKPNPVKVVPSTADAGDRAD